MSKFKQKVKSIFGMKCPACLKGDLFLEKNPYKVSRLFDMPETCSCCGEKFTPEPGFYFGAMYISYALTVAMAVTIVVSNNLFNWNLTTLQTVIAVGTSIFLAIPVLFRVSRSIWINIFVKYKGGQCQTKES